LPGNTPAPERKIGAAEIARWLTFAGHVQGVGFRPFVFRLAHRLGLTGRVWNAVGAVEIEIQGPEPAVSSFVAAVISEAPPLARPQLLRCEPLAVQASPPAFSIDASSSAGTPQIFVPADQFACDDCLAELADPRNRRYRYPFINCTQCGPRYTLIERLPYDRPNTTMAAFELCGDCQREYRDPFDRRYHAEPIACPVCGPQVTWRVAGTATELRGEGALEACVQRLRAQGIVAVKGIGGYHLLCDARSDAAVQTLRDRKQRPHKPLALLYPRRGADGLTRVRDDASMDDSEAESLRDPSRPIVLLRKRAGSTLAASVAPGLGEIGVFLPYSPLHQLLLEDFGGPLVATSGNLSGEPVITDAAMAEEKLARVADAFLHHDRPIVRPADDSVWRCSAGAMRPIRLGRGHAPLELELPESVSTPVLATGAHLKNCLALAWQKRVVISPHIGTMDSLRSLEVFQQVASDLQRLYGVTAERIVCDRHPGYATSRWAQRCGLPLTRVWHHRAHAAALAAEHRVSGLLLVFCWDGLGLGEDGTLWGGEALLGQPGAWRRVASLRPFRLPGGDLAARQPWRPAASLCWHADRQWPEQPANTELLQSAWQRGVQSPWTSSAGRLFDAAAALVLGIREASFEAQAPMQLESIAAPGGDPLALAWDRDETGLPRLDWSPLLPMLMDAHASQAERAARFHESLAAAVSDFASGMARHTPLAAIGLTGGVFQNRRLAESCIARLTDIGLPVLLAQRLPANDAAICLGQVVELAADEGGAC
jgi:hydrogenase maturation protein HypF